MRGARRNTLVASVVIGCVVVGVMFDSAAVLAQSRVELGGDLSAVAPSCPSQPCIVDDQTTGLQAAIAGKHRPFVATGSGRIVAWTIKLARPSKAQIKYFDEHNGAPAAAITILRPAAHLRFAVVAVGPLTPLSAFGQTKTYQLRQPLAMRPGDTVGLTVPTWAPVLALGGDRGTVWRASRPTGACTDVTSHTAQLAVGAVTQYRCQYRMARLAYSATFLAGTGR